MIEVIEQLRGGFRDDTAECEEWPARLALLKAAEARAKGYIEQRNGGYFVAGSRVSLDSVVYAFLRGESPEGIAESFPALDLEQIFGALAFDMANWESVDHYLREGLKPCVNKRGGTIRHSTPSLPNHGAELIHPVHEAALPGGRRVQPQDRG